MALPLIAWGIAAAIGAVAGGAAVVVTTDAAKEIGQATERATSGVNRLLTTTALVGAAYLAYRHRKELLGVFK